MEENSRPGIKGSSSFRIPLNNSWFNNTEIIQPPEISFNIKDVEFYSNIKNRKIIMFVPQPYIEYIIEEKVFNKILEMVNNGKQDS